MNIGLVVVLAGLAWVVVGVLVALTVGGMAGARDLGALPRVEHPLAGGRYAPPAHDEAVRTAV